jgi:AcrR family transcriptional regulator
VDNRPHPPRTKNPRGFGPRLRNEILEAAGHILDRTGRDEAVTLRAVAREVGITGPSIYAHFSGRDAIMESLVDEGFIHLQRQVEESHVGLADSVDRLMAGSVAYLYFARTEPQRYRLMFTWTSPSEKGADHPSATAFAVLVAVIAQCADDSRSSSVDPFADATAVWAGLHGLALLRTQQPMFPWPDEGALVRHLVHSLARITA